MLALSQAPAFILTKTKDYEKKFLLFESEVHWTMPAPCFLGIVSVDDRDLIEQFEIFVYERKMANYDVENILSEFV